MTRTLRGSIRVVLAVAEWKLDDHSVGLTGRQRDLENPTLPNHSQYSPIFHIIITHYNDYDAVG